MTPEMERAWQIDQNFHWKRLLTADRLREKHKRAILEAEEAGLPTYPRPLAPDTLPKRRGTIKSFISQFLP